MFLPNSYRGETYCATVSDQYETSDNQTKKVASETREDSLFAKYPVVGRCKLSTSGAEDSKRGARSAPRRRRRRIIRTLIF